MQPPKLIAEQLQIIPPMGFLCLTCRTLTTHFWEWEYVKGEFILVCNKCTTVAKQSTYEEG